MSIRGDGNGGDITQSPEPASFCPCHTQSHTHIWLWPPWSILSPLSPETAQMAQNSQHSPGVTLWSHSGPTAPPRAGAGPAVMHAADAVHGAGVVHAADAVHRADAAVHGADAVCCADAAVHGADTVHNTRAWHRAPRLAQTLRADTRQHHGSPPASCSRKALCGCVCLHSHPPSPSLPPSHPSP